MATKNTPLSYTTSGLLATAATARGLNVRPRLLDAAWEDSNTSYILIGETEDNFIRCDFSNAASEVRRWDQITERRMWTAVELEKWIGTKFPQNYYRHEKVNNSWITELGYNGVIVTGTDNDEAESFAKAAIAWLNNPALPVNP